MLPGRELRILLWFYLERDMRIVTIFVCKDWYTILQFHFPNLLEDARESDLLGRFAQSGYVNLLNWAKEQLQWPLGKYFWNLAAAGGFVITLNWGLNNGTSNPQQVLRSAVRHNQFDAAVWSLQQGAIATVEELCTVRNDLVCITNTQLLIDIRRLSTAT